MDLHKACVSLISMDSINKSELLQMIVSQKEEKLDLLVKAAFEAKEFSTNEESKAENKYDTRGLEASYLASGQVQRAKKLQEEIYLLKKVNLEPYPEESSIGIGALVELLVDETQKKILFVLPSGGEEVSFSGLKVQSVTIESPIGKKIHNQSLGHDFEINGKLYEVIGLQ